MHLLEQNALDMQQNHPMKMKCHLGKTRKHKSMFIVVFESNKIYFAKVSSLFFKIDSVFEDGVSAPAGCSSLLNEHTHAHTDTHSCANIIHVYQCVKRKIGVLKSISVGHPSTGNFSPALPPGHRV